MHNCWKVLLHENNANAYDVEIKMEFFSKARSEHDNGDGDAGIQLGWPFNLRLVF